MTTIICDNCGTGNPDNVKFCKQCGNKLPVQSAEPVRSTFMHTAPTSQPAATIKKRYPVLRAVAGLSNALGAIFAALILLGGVISLFAGVALARELGFFGIFGIGGSFIGLITSAIMAGITYALFRIVGERILVQLDTEENTRRIAELLERQMK